ncbi:MAG: penicillin-binding protein 2 [Spiribacter sp.]|nr:penicillin-binding protein 2 [Spiribacter sp.]MDR9454644.1 penicillin-binding protein 2 [Spiribacter sp.]
MSLDMLRDKAGERRVVRSRLAVVSVILVLVFGAILGRVAYLQIVEHEQLTKRSQDNRIRLAPVDATRGLILDRSGQTLAENRPAFSLTIVPEQVADMDALLSELDALIDISEAERAAFAEARARSRSFQEIPLRMQLSEETVAELAINRHRFPGVEVRPRLARHYPYGEVGAHVVGYVGRINERELRQGDPNQYRSTSLTGKAGVERFYEPRLQGELGIEHIETNALGRSIATLERRPPTPGEDIQLTLDIELQRLAEETLGDYRGAIVALDPRDGSILALASRPRFDPNALSRGIDQDTLDALNRDVTQPLFNRAIAGRYPPGSVVKPFLGLAGAAGGHINPNETLYCNGTFELPDVSRVWRDWKPEGHGHVDLTQSVAQSCDIYFYELANDMGINAMHEWMSRFGYGQATGIDLPGERAGVMPSRAWKRETRGEPWYTGETINTGIGQGFTLATPIQMATSTALIANRGRPIRPQLLADREALSLGPTIEPVELADEAYWQHAWDGMIETVHGRRGTARHLGADLDFRMAGKTGTAQVVGIAQDEEYDEETLDARFHDHALFTAFAPVEDPRIAVAVVVENGGSGSQTAAPMAKTVIEAWLSRTDG